MAHILFYPVGDKSEEVKTQQGEDNPDLPTLPDPNSTTDPLEH